MTTKLICDCNGKRPDSVCVRKVFQHRSRLFRRLTYEQLLQLNVQCWLYGKQIKGSYGCGPGSNTISEISSAIACPHDLGDRNRLLRRDTLHSTDFQTSSIILQIISREAFFQWFYSTNQVPIPSATSVYLSIEITLIFTAVLLQTTWTQCSGWTESTMWRVIQ